MSFRSRTTRDFLSPLSRVPPGWTNSPYTSSRPLFEHQPSLLRFTSNVSSYFPWNLDRLLFTPSKASSFYIGTVPDEKVHITSWKQSHARHFESISGISIAAPSRSVLISCQDLSPAYRMRLACVRTGVYGSCTAKSSFSGLKAT